MAGTPEWVPQEVDTRRANVARVYDYWLGGSHNFLADQDVARAIAAVEPNMPAIARANRAFLGRAVRFLAAAGIRQFLDIGSGIPTEGNVHEIAQRADPDARVAYVDIDPVAVAHSKAILAGRQNATVIEADLRDPEKVLAAEAVRRLIDTGSPVGLLLMVVLHFIADADDPWRIVATLRDALAPGSYLVLGHATHEGEPVVARATEKVYNRSVATGLHLRSRAEILRFFDGFELADPGLVYVPLWRPDSPADVPGDPHRFQCLVGVALCGGRLVLAVGAAFPGRFGRPQHALSEVPWERRFTRLDETVALWRQLWTRPDLTSFHGQVLHFDELPPMTTPARAGGPPIWLGGATPAALRRTGRLYDGWMPYPPEPASYRDGLAAVRQAATDDGRDASAITPALFVSVAVTDSVAAGRELLAEFSQANYGLPLDQLETIQAVVAGPAEHVAERLRGYVAAGVRHLACRLATTSLAAQREQLEQIIKLKPLLSAS